MKTLPKDTGKVYMMQLEKFQKNSKKLQIDRKKEGIIDQKLTWTMQEMSYGQNDTQYEGLLWENLLREKSLNSYIT